jgi:hypothetical protein
MRFFLSWLSLCLLGAGMAARAQEPWQASLAAMPLAEPATELDRSNCVPLMLRSFQSNAVVKALVFMPGATDEIYFFKRARARLTNANPSLLDAVIALTNQTFIEADFRPPLLLLHTTEDSLDGVATVKNESTAAKLRGRIVPVKLLVNDADWDQVHATAGKYLHIGLRPRKDSPDSWHFYRHSFAAQGISEWDLLETLALAGKTTFTVNWLTAEFIPDRRQGAPPQLDRFPH